MSFNVSGLSSGIDTNALLDGLMYAEGAAKRRLEASKTGDQKALDAWSQIETKLGTVDTAVKAILTGKALASAQATSSDETVARVTASSGALAGTYAFQVSSLAAANQVASAGMSGATELVGAGTATVTGGLVGIGVSLSGHALVDGTYRITVDSVDTDTSQATITFDGVEQTVDYSGGSFTLTASDGGTVTLAGTPQTGSASITVVEADASTTVSELAAKLNAAGGPVRAQLVDTGDGTATPTRLIITSRKTGLDGEADIDLSALSAFSGGLTTLRGAADAVISLGGGALEITRSTNTIGDLFSGVTVDLVGTTAGSDVEITVGADVDAKVKAVKSVVTSVSDVLRSLSTYRTYDVDSKTGGPLVGDFANRSVTSDLEQAMGTVVSSSSFVLLSQIGITFQQDGTYRVDDVKLRDAVANDPEGVEQLLVGDPTDTTDGIFDVVKSTLDDLGDADGRITAAKDAREANIRELDKAIASQEARLADVEARYRRQFASMETLLGQLQGQSSYLSSVIGSF